MIGIICAMQIEADGINCAYGKQKAKGNCQNDIYKRNA